MVLMIRKLLMCALQLLSFASLWTGMHGSPLPDKSTVEYRLVWNPTKNCCDLIASNGDNQPCGAQVSHDDCK